jgi:crotonobetainyl-CoA:carnitine CoA-transferase CaiB-like acyl-CoA transferase
VRVSAPPISGAAGKKSREETDLSQVLAGVRVLDFGRYIAGPYCAALLADHGAEVIRVEKLTGGEDRFVAPVSESGEGGLFMQMNRNKKSMTLDPMTSEGAAVVRRLVATADVVVANLPTQTLKVMKLDYDNLRATKENIILATASAFGSTGPYAERVGFDSIGQAMSGAIYMTGEPGQPYRCPAPYVDFGTALGLAFGTLAALMERGRTGKGQIVEGALLRTALNMMGPALIEQAIIKVNREPTANRGQTSAPSDILPTRDGFVLVAVVGQPLFVRWAKLMGNEEFWLGDPRFKDDLARGDNAVLISARMREWCAERTTAEAIAALEAARIPAGPVLSPQQALDDIHVVETGYLQPVGYPGMNGTAPVPRSPVILSETPGEIRTRAPLLGEHTDEVLMSVGYSAEEISKLREKKII